MFKELFTEATIHPLDKPLTDTEVKKLAAYEKRMEKGKKRRHGTLYGLDALKPEEIEQYNNIKARAGIPQKTFELATLNQLSKIV